MTDCICRSNMHPGCLAALLAEERGRARVLALEEAEKIVMHYHGSEGSRDIPRDDAPNGVQPFNVFNLLLKIQGQIHTLKERT